MHKAKINSTLLAVHKPRKRYKSIEKYDTKKIYMETHNYIQ